jgi:subtilisin family serine protease
MMCFRKFIWTFLIYCSASQILLGQELAVNEVSNNKDEYIVRFKKELAVANVVTRALESNSDLSMTKSDKKLNAVVIRAPMMNLVELRRLLQDSSAIESIEPNRVYFVDQSPQNEVTSVGEWTNIMWHFQRLEIKEAWKIQSEASNIVIAVIDTGVFYNHPLLKNSIWRNQYEIPNDKIDNDSNGYIDDIIGWNFFDDTDDPRPSLVADAVWGGLAPSSTKKTFENHGTRVAGIIAASEDKLTGISGIVPNAKIMPLKVFGDWNGRGDAISIAAAIHYAVDNGAKIINASFGNLEDASIVRDAVAYAASKRVLFVASAGNSSNDNDNSPHFPSSINLPNVIAVAATDQNDNLANFSNYGLQSVHVAAPGDRIYTINPDYSEQSSQPGPGFAQDRGTSMAVPQVSAVLALDMAHFPLLDISELKRLLMNSTDKEPQLAVKVKSGGRINALATLKRQTPSINSIRETTPQLFNLRQPLVGNNFIGIQKSLLERSSYQESIVGSAFHESRSLPTPRATNSYILQLEEGSNIEKLKDSIETVGNIIRTQIPNTYELRLKQKLPISKVRDMFNHSSVLKRIEPNIQYQIEKPSPVKRP